MWFPPMPSTDDLSLFINWQCIHILSNRKYHEYVTEEAAQPDKVPPLHIARTACLWRRLGRAHRHTRTRTKTQTWAQDMLKSVAVVDAYVSFFCDYILQLSRRKYGGLSALCRIMPNALPITHDYTSWTLNNCIVTGIEQRPCFEIMSGKHGETSSFVHHAEIQCCQSVWAIMHLQQILACGVSCFKEHHTDTNLTPTIEAFALSEERQKLMDYCAYAFDDVRQTFLEDNIVQNNTNV